MDTLAVTMGIIGAIAGGAGGWALHVLGDFAGMFVGLAAAFAGARPGEHEHKEPSRARFVATGALAGGLIFGGVPAVYDHFHNAAQPASHQVTMAECAKNAPANVSKIEIATQPDGLKVCRYTP